jgi:hypothetical protein
MARHVRDSLATRTFRDCANSSLQKVDRAEDCSMLGHGGETIILASPAERPIHLVALKQYVARRIRNFRLAKTFRAQ